MAKDAVATMGNTLPDDVGGRDAVHVAVFAATSGERLKPGQPVALIQQSTTDAVVASEGEAIGIVDPFIKQDLEPNSRFWVYLLPRTITALSHRWQHPSFDETSSLYATPTERAKAEAWLRNFVKKETGWEDLDGEDYREVLRAAAYAIESDTKQEALFVGTQIQGHIPSEFWDNIEVILGMKYQGKRPTYFTCSC